MASLGRRVSSLRSRELGGGLARSVIACALVLAPRPSLAEPAPAEPAAEGGASTQPPEDDQVARAMAAYDRGRQNYNLAQYDAALADFTEAASLYASPDFQYNIGLCHEKLGKYDEAIRAFTAYLRAKPDAEDRPNVENRIQMLQQELERRRREAEDAEAARIAAQGREPDPQPAPSAADEPDEPAEASPGRPMIVAGASLAGLGAAVALGGGIAFGVLAGRRSDAVDAVQSGNPDALTYDQTLALEREGKRFEGVQIGLIAGGAVVGVTGAVLLALGLRQRQAAKDARAQARLVPSLGGGHAGLVLTGRF